MPTHLHPPGLRLAVVLLDIDGTLIDSNDAHCRAWVASLADHGYVVPFEEIRPLIGMGGDKILPTVAGLDPESGQGKAIAEARSKHFARELPSLRPTRGARELLVRIKQEGLELVVATSATGDEVKALLQQAGVADLIETAASSDDADVSKPNPDIIMAALEKARCLPSHAVMIGDTPYDILAATRARVPTIAFRCGGGWSDAELGDAIAIYDDPAELAGGLASSPLARGHLTI